MASTSRVSDIRSFLVEQLKNNTFFGDNNIPIYWENIRNKEPSNSSYLRFWFTQSDVNRIELGRGAQDFRNGFIQVDVVCPLDVGVGTAYKLSYEVEKTYERCLSGRYNDTAVRVVRVVVEQPVVTDKHFQQPITIYWESYTTPIKKDE